MPKQLSSILLILYLALLAACGGGEEPPTPTPLATFTPTVAPTIAPTIAPTVAPAATATEAATPSPEATDTPAATTAAEAAGTDTGTEAATTSATPAMAAGDTAFGSPLVAPDSPLAVPDSPLPPPALADSAAPTAAPLLPVTGSWQLQTIKTSSSGAAGDAPGGYSIAFGPTGVVRVLADCKTGRGHYTNTPEGEISIALTYSDATCAPDSLAEPFVRSLNSVTVYRYEDEQLVLTYGAQGSEMALGRTLQMATFGAPFLRWSTLKNSTYFVPEAPAGDNQASLVEGEFRARLAPQATETAGEPATEAAATDELTATTGQTAAATPVPGGSEFVVSLSTMHTYGVLVTPSPEEIAADPEINAEVAVDSVVVLVIDAGLADAAPRSYIAPVLNGGGMSLPLQLELLGENIFVRDLRWDGTLLTVEFDGDSGAIRRTYRFDSDHFVLESEEQLPGRSLRARLDLPAQAVTLGAADAPAEDGGSQTVLTGAINAGEIHPYRLPLVAGQQLSVTIESPFENVWLSIFGRDQTVLRTVRSDTTHWEGPVPSTQEYFISAIAPGSSSSYTLTIAVAGEGDAAAAPVAPEPEVASVEGETQTVHLVIDAAPAQAAELLDVLQRNAARADFFLPADQLLAADGAGQALELSTAVAQAGHGLGLIASPIRALTSDGRDALFGEISAASSALGDQRAFCLRLPAAASDSYTRAEAAELGYDVLQWDIDASGAATPDAVVSRVFPGAVIRLGSGDDGDVPVAALEALLSALTQAGSSVQPLCTPS